MEGASHNAVGSAHAIPHYFAWILDHYRDARQSYPCRSYLALLPLEIFNELMYYSHLVRWYDPSATMRCTHTFRHTSAQSVNSVLFLNGNTLITAASDFLIRIWNLQAPVAPPIVLAGHTLSVWVLAKVDDSTFLSGGLDANVLTWKVASNSPAARFTAARSVYGLAVPQSDRVIVSGKNSLELWDLTRSEPLHSRKLSWHLWDLSLPPTPSDFVVSASKQVQLWKWRTLELVKSFSLPEEVMCVDFDGRFIAAGGSFGHITVWSLSDDPTNLLNVELKSKALVTRVKIVGRSVAATCWDTCLHVYSFAHSCIRSAPVHSDRVRGLCLDDKLTLATCGDSGACHVWTLQ